MVRTVLRLFLPLFLLLSLFPLLVVVVPLSFFVLLLVGVAGLFTRRQVLSDVAVVLVLLVFLFVLPRRRCVENAIFFRQL